MSSQVPGRDSECEQLDELLRAVRSGSSRALVIRGEPGIGKTRLLEYLVERARGFRLARVTGIQSEMELVFAGLHQLCAGMSGELDALPPQQRAALAAALGQGSEPAPDGFLVALGVLGLLAEVARERPLLCVVDDAQWVDRASMQALAFAARRLGSESMAVVFAVRSPLGPAESEPVEPVGLPELRLRGLREDDACELLRATIPGSWDEHVLRRVAVETRGNPLALLELPRTAGPVELAGGFGLPAARGVDARLRAAYLGRVGELPVVTQRLLLVAAADPTGEPTVLWLAAEHLGIHVGAAGPAVAAGLLEIGDRVWFAHPIVRSVVYWAAPPEVRREAHRALAEATDPGTDPDRRAWHAAQGSPGPDETIAAELERCAVRARVRGGLAAAAAFAARAVELTPDPQRRRDRALVAAKATHEAGNPDIALKLLSLAEAGLRDDRLRAEAELVRARIAFTTDRGIAAPGLLLDAARQLARHDARSARETYLEVIDAAIFAGPKAYRPGQYEAALGARATPAVADPDPVDLLLDALATRILDGHAAAVPALRTALQAFRRSALSPDKALRWLWLNCVTAVGLWDDEALAELSIRNLDLMRATGRASALPIALTLRSIVHVLDGELTEAESLAAEILTVSEAVATATPVYPAMLAAGWRGREADCLELSRRADEGEQLRGEGIGPVIGGYARAVLYNGLERFGEAAEAARAAHEQYIQLEVGAPVWSLAEFVEAATRSGAADEAFAALVRLTEFTGPGGTDWAMGIQARSHALISAGPDAEDLYRQAISDLGRTRLRGELARAHLVYGEWLCAEHRVAQAREQLHTAHDLFTAMGMAGFAHRAARALAGTGEKIDEHHAESGEILTPEETQVVKLVQDGLTDAEIGERLFLSQRTVEWHLGNLCTKLGLPSRHHLETRRPAP